jgi:pimeloyl-ACP methyl ester carboxylesterase
MNLQISLNDGRLIGFAEYGSPDGKPVVYCHGFPSSRLDWQLFHDDKALLELAVRVIAIDRPGYGLSDPKRGRKLLDWPSDVADLADRLGIDHFAVLGISGGGPFALSCAYRLSDRLTRVGIVSGMGPSDSPGMKEGVSWTIPGTPALMRRFILMLTSMGIKGDPDKFMARSKASFSELDTKLLDRPELADLFIIGMQEAFRQGVGAAGQDASIYKSPWGFGLQEITAEVQLWHGEQDLNVPVSVAQYVAEAIPGCQARFHQGEGHLTLAHNHIREILETLIM